MTFEEKKVFPYILKIKDINKEIIYKIKELLIGKINEKDLTGQKMVEILSKLNHHFNDETFSKKEKENIFNFIIEKCKDNDNEMMKEYKKEKIWELFLSKKEKELFLDILKKNDFDKANNFLDLFPEELSESDRDAILF